MRVGVAEVFHLHCSRQRVFILRMTRLFIFPLCSSPLFTRGVSSTCQTSRRPRSGDREIIRKGWRHDYGSRLACRRIIAADWRCVGSPFHGLDGFAFPWSRPKYPALTKYLSRMALSSVPSSASHCRDFPPRVPPHNPPNQLRCVTSSALPCGRTCPARLTCRFSATITK